MEGTKGGLWRCETCNEEWVAERSGPCRKCGQPGRPLPSKPCPSCGAPLRLLARSCRYCGAQLETTFCTSCHQSVARGTRICPTCGADPNATPGTSGAVEAAPATDVRPLLVSGVGLLHVLVGAHLTLIAVLGLRGSETVTDWFSGLFVGGWLLLPAGVILTVGAGIFLRSEWALGGAVLLGVAILLFAGFDAIRGVVHVAQEMGRASYHDWQPTRAPGAGHVVAAVIDGLTIVLGAVVYLLVLTSEPFNRRFKRW